MNHWTQTHVLAGYVGMLILDGVLLAVLAVASKRIQRKENE